MRSKCTQMHKCRYVDNYLSLNFTKTIINEEERPQCVICLVVLTSDGMKPNKLIHLNTKHGELANKPNELFNRKLNSVKSAKIVFFNVTSITSKALLASYQVSNGIARKKKSHTIEEELILLAAIDIVPVMFREFMAEQLKTIPISNNTVSR